MQITGMLSLKRTAQEDLGRTLLNRANGVEQCFIAGTYRWAIRTPCYPRPRLNHSVSLPPIVTTALVPRT
jgi:hypothetical protein